MSIRKAIIAAGGWSTRFLPAVKTYPKQLVPIFDKPIIQIVLEELIGAGIDEVCIVHRPGELMFRKHFARDKELEKYLKDTGKEECLKSLRFIWDTLKIHFVPQYRHLPYGNAAPILAAKNFVKNEPFVYLFADDLILEEKPGNYLLHLIKIFNKYLPTVVLGSQEVPLKEISRYSSIKYKAQSKIPHQMETIVEKPKPEEAFSNITQFGRFVYSNKVIPILENQKTGRGNELWLTDLNNGLAQADIAIAQPTEKSFWMTTGDPLNCLKTSIAFGMKDEKIRKGLIAYLEEIIKNKRIKK